MTLADPFDILGIPGDASPDAIKRAFRKLAMRWHPDRNHHAKAAEDRFKDIRAAYEIAIDPDAYAAWLRERATATDGVEAHVLPLSLTLEQAASGGTQRVEIPRRKTCAPCTGSGRLSRTHSVPCPRCHGIGRTRTTGKDSSQCCAGCAGKGYVRELACAACGGTGAEILREIFEVRLPAGLHAGEKVRLAHRLGDIHLVIALLPHPIFRLGTQRPNDLHCTMPVNIARLLRGGRFEVPTLHGTVTHALPPGIPRAPLRLPGMGFPSRHRARAGDLVVDIIPIAPPQLTDAEAALLLQLDQAFARHPDPRLREWDAALREHCRLHAL